jgi:protein-tyrosine phosphatase
VIDLHAHVLPGLDDGPRTVSEALELARVAVAAGTRVMVATPHVNQRYSEAVEALPGAVAALERELARAAIPLELRAGAEIAADRLDELDDDALGRLALGGGPWLLLEVPSHGPADVAGAVAAVRERGRGAVLAHAERCEAVRRDPSLLRRLVRDGTLVSITADSLAGRFGETARRFGLLLLEERLVHNVASDAHHARRRPPGVLAGRQAAERALPDVAGRWSWLTEEVPQAVLAGDAVPPAPRPQPRGLKRFSAGRGG